MPPRSKKKKEPRRVVIVFDGKKWHVRRLASSMHVASHAGGVIDEMIYTADMPIANDLETPDQAVEEAMRWLDHYP